MLRMFGYSWILHVGGKIGRAMSEACRTTWNLDSRWCRIEENPRKLRSNWPVAGFGQLASITEFTFADTDGRPCICRCFILKYSQRVNFFISLHCALWNFYIVHSPTYALLLNLGKFKIYIKRQISLLHVSVFEHHQGACTEPG